MFPICSNCYIELYEEVKSHPERVSNIKPFINKCNCEGMNYLSKMDDWKTFEKNSLTNCS